MDKPDDSIPAPGRLYHFADQSLQERWQIEQWLSRRKASGRAQPYPASAPFGRKKRTALLKQYFLNRENCRLVPLDPDNYACLPDPEQEDFGDNLGQVLYWHSKWPSAAWFDCETGKLLSGI